MKKQIIAVVFFVSSLNVLGQNEQDALRYSYLHSYGTAKFNGMSGALSSVGSDLSMISLNPAGLAAYKKSEFSFTPALIYTTSNTTYRNEKKFAQRYDYIFSNAGFAWNFNDFHPTWHNIAVGIGYNRQANFNNQVSIHGFSDKSLLTPYVNTLNQGKGTDPLTIAQNYPFDIDLAYQTYLISPTPSDSNKYFHELEGSSHLEHTKTISQKGGIGETYFAFAANYDNRVYLGATIAFPNLRFIEETSYTESTNYADTSTIVKSYNYNSYIRTSGNGVNAKIGVIYRPIEWFRTALSIHTPTFFGLTDRWATDISAIYKDGSDYSKNSPNGQFDYGLTTPGRIIGAMSFDIAEKGLISVDYEVVDYSSARLRSANSRFNTGYSFDKENNNIKSLYKPSQNIRVGTEWSFANLRIRGGYSLYGSPYNAAFSSSGAKQSVTGGLGYRTDEYFIDLGYIYTLTNNSFQLFPGSSTVSTSRNNHLLCLSLGFRY